MKILHIDTGREWRGGQRQVLFLHEGLLSSGIESIIVCNEKGELCKKGLPGLIPVSFKGETDLSFLSELKAIIKHEKPDVVHTHDAHSLTPALFAKITSRNFRLINTRRVDFSINKGFLSRKKYSNSQVDCIVAISNAIKKILVDDGIKADNIPVIPSGVRFPKNINYSRVLELREKYGINDETYVIGNIANISDHKDHRTLINSFDKFCEVVDDAKLIIVGGGPMFDEIKNYSADFSCADSIIFTGHVEDVYEHISIFDVFCMSSKTEGLCTSIIDALFMGRPVAATRAGGIPELVKHNFNGLLSEVGNSDELSENLLEIYDDMIMESKFSANAFHTALKFSEGAMVTRYIKLYNALVSA
ncbi:MAG: hypothetical protein C0602_13500 [Denitrovibrio sp.]|nr:MAG: hypothetical protein C0602_13500 [Denitrovibrio sp.]